MLFIGSQIIKALNALKIKSWRSRLFIYFLAVLREKLICWVIWFVLQFYEELVHGKGSGLKLSEDQKPSNKKIKFSYSDSSSSDDDDDHENKQEGEAKAEEEQENGVDEENKSDTRGDDASHDNPTTEKSDHQKKGSHDNATNEKSDHQKKDDASQDNATTEKSDHHKKDDGCDGNKTEEKIKDTKEDNVSKEISTNEAKEPPAKKQCLGTNSSKCTIPYEVEEKSIDKLIEAELQELGDKNKVTVFNLLIYMIRLCMLVCVCVMSPFF